MDNEEYLEPGFDANTLKVAQLRGILLKHDVDYPSACKKADLVALFNAHIAPQAERLRHATSIVLPSTAGMVNARRPGDPEPEPPVEATPRRARRPTRGVTETGSEDEERPTRSERKTPVRKTPVRQSLDVYGDEAPPSTIRGTRRSSARPAPVYETPARHTDKENDSDAASSTAETPFSSKNPFQSGSSPFVGRSPERSGRKSLPAASAKRDSSRRKTDIATSLVAGGSTANRRRTQGLDTPRYRSTYEDGRERDYAPSAASERKLERKSSYNHNEYVPVYNDGHEQNYSAVTKPARRSERKSRSHTDYTPASRRTTYVKQETYSDEDTGFEGEMEAGEEFVPEEAAELAASPPQELIRRNRTSNALVRPIKSGVKMLWVLLLPMLFAYGVWFRKEKIDVGYCGVGGLGGYTAPHSTFASAKWRKDTHESTEDTFADLIRPECEPCPPHARCYPGFQLECENDYIKAPKWISLGGLVPVSPECLPDTAKERRKSIMSDAALQILRESGAQQRCKERFLSSDMPIEGVSEEDIRQVLYDRKAVSPASWIFYSLSFIILPCSMLTFLFSCRRLCRTGNSQNSGERL